MSRFKNKYIIFLMSFIILLLSVVNVNAISQSSVDNYRVRVHTSSSTVNLKATSKYKIYIDDVENKYVLKDNDSIDIIKNNSSLEVKVRGTSLGTGTKIDIRKTVGSITSIELKVGSSYVQYPDNMRFMLSSDKSVINCINVTNLETYLMGVLPHEMGANAPLEALKAQAVTARTLAVDRVNKYQSEGYDIRNDTSDQVYKGYDSRYFASTHNVYKAVEQTKGVVLKYGNSLVTGLFYSNNGGMTASDANVWSSGTQTPYYKSKVDEYDKSLHSTTAGWSILNYSETYTAEELRNIIINNSTAYSGYYKGNYMTPAFTMLSENFKVEVKNDVNGYVTLSVITDDAGRVYNVKNYANRWVYGLRSQQFKMTSKTNLSVKSDTTTTTMNNVYVKSATETKWVDNNNLYVQDSNSITKPNPSTYTFTGAGYGHGIGMSQNGAMNRADAGHSYKDILGFYYDGCVTATGYGN